MLNCVDPNDIYLDFRSEAQRLSGLTIPQHQLHLLLENYVRENSDFDLGLTEQFLHSNVTLADFLNKSVNGYTGLWWALLGVARNRSHAWEHFKYLYEKAHAATLSKKLGITKTPQCDEVGIADFLLSPLNGEFKGVSGLQIIRYVVSIFNQTDILSWLAQHLNFKLDKRIDEQRENLALSEKLISLQQQIEQLRIAQLTQPPPTLTFRAWAKKPIHQPVVVPDKQHSNTKFGLI